MPRQPTQFIKRHGAISRRLRNLGAFVAGINKEEFPPLLPVGSHSFDLAGCRRLCLERFPGSVTRPEIMRNLERTIMQIHDHQISGDLWIDGSFLTEKLNPGDVDVVWVISRPVFESLSAKQRIFFEQFRDVPLISLRIDNYTLILDQTDLGEWMRAYWIRQFGFSRADDGKGILRISIPLTVTR